MIKFLNDKGFHLVRQSGTSHAIYENHLGKSIPVPIHKGKDLKRLLAINIINQAGYSKEDFLNWKYKK